MGVNIGVFITNQSDRRAEKLMQLIRASIPGARCTTITMHSMVPEYWTRKKNTKSVYQISENARPRVEQLLEKISEGHKYDAFVSIDLALAKYVLPARDAESVNSIDKIGGMLIEIGGKPCLLHSDPIHTYVRNKTPEEKAAAAFMSSFMLKKLNNRMTGMVESEKPIKFTVPTTTAAVDACVEIARRSSLIAYDIETSGTFISCCGFACEMRELPYTPVFVIPFFVNIPGTGGDFWHRDHDFFHAMDAVGTILANDVYKVPHNGGFDNTHLIRYGWHVNNHIFDTMLMLHSTWPTIPKALYIGCSMFLARYRYWKDDGKDVGDDGKVKWQTPTDPEKTYRYWYYNGLDCANTLELCLAILDLWQGDKTGRFPPQHESLDYFWRTYVRKFALEFGPAMYMSCVGIRASKDRQARLKSKLLAEGVEALEDLQLLLDDPFFNPNSPQQVAHIIYDVLGIKPLARKGRITDKRVLQKFSDMHVIYEDVISSIKAAKEPANNASKYGDMPYFADEWWMYQLKASITTTARLASSKNNLGYGTNMQNVPKPMRVVCHAEKGEYLVSSDYSQSDSYFVAFESQDAVMMETVTDDRDTHSVHVEFFFGHDYDDVVAGDRAKEAWVVDPVTGVRQIIKKVSHGTNYDMGGETMLMNIRKDAAIAMVQALLSSKNSLAFMKYMGLDSKKSPQYYISMGAMWSDQLLARACDFAQRLYYARYPQLSKWKKQAVNLADMNLGVIEMFGGSSTRMLAKPHSNERFVPAAYGQGGTSGNINNAMLRLYYLNQDMWDRGFRLLIQVHDELVCAVPQNELSLIRQKIAIMETPCEIHGRSFSIPVEAEITKSWDPKNTVVWKPSMSDNAIHAKVAEAEAKTLSKLGM